MSITCTPALKDRWYTPTEVAERWGCHEETVRTMFRRGEFKKAMKTAPGRSGHIRISAASILERERIRGNNVV